jgi:methyltransferase family protein
METYRSSIKRWIVQILASFLPPRMMKSKKFFDIWEHKGYHVTPVHFYEPIPDTRELPAELWTRQSELSGIKFNDDRMIELLTRFVSCYRSEYQFLPANKTDIPYQYYLNNGAFVSVDGEILYCIIREFKPRRLIEIGSGNTTYLSAQAIRANRGDDSSYQCHLTAIEPYPNAILKKGFSELSELIEKPVQAIPLSFFDALSEGDILFIDSSHTAKIGSDVLYEYLEILPRLNKGVLVHFHDIFLPAEYPKEWIFKERHFWNEQYILQAFMIYNDTFEIIWPGSYMHHKYPGKLEEAFPSYDRRKTMPGSFWIRKTQ